MNSHSFCSNSIAVRTQHYNLSISSNNLTKSKGKFSKKIGRNHLDFLRISYTFMEHPVERRRVVNAYLDRVFSFVFTLRKVGSPSPPLPSSPSCYWKSFRVFAGKIDSPPLGDFPYCVCGQRTVRIKPENLCSLAL